MTSAIGKWAFALSIGILGAVAIDHVRNAETRDNQSLALERRAQQCLVVRQGLEMARNNLWASVAAPGDVAQREWTRSTYMASTRNKWTAVDACAAGPLNVGPTCLDADLSCQLHALDWALVNIR